MIPQPSNSANGAMLSPQAPMIEVYSGGFVDLLNPDPATLKLEDIARGMAYTCRYGGHIKRYYSVAEHAVLVYDLLRWMGAAHEIQRAGTRRPWTASLASCRTAASCLMTSSGSRAGRPTTLPRYGFRRSAVSDGSTALVYAPDLDDWVWLDPRVGDLWRAPEWGDGDSYPICIDPSLVLHIPTTTFPGHDHA